MAKDSQEALIYFVCLHMSEKEHLGNVRLWDNIKLAYDEHSIWLKDLTPEQAISVDINSIPGCKIYYQKNNKLFLRDSLLPDRNIPSLLWTPIARALPVTLPPYNNNFMGFGDNLPAIHLVPSEEEQEAFALMTEVSQLNEYIQTAPSVRLKKLKWTILNTTQVLIIGTPLLPIKGGAYWRYKRLLFPVGYQLNFPILSDQIHARYTTPDTCLCWVDEHNCIQIDLTCMEELSLASFRRTFKTVGV